jgi:hypothetical protein
VQQQSVRRRIDIRRACVIANIMQPVGRDDAMQILQRRAGGGSRGRRRALTHTTDDSAFVQ